MKSYLKLERSPSIRTCFPERLSVPSSVDGSQENSAKSTTTGQDLINDHDHMEILAESWMEEYPNAEQLLRSKRTQENLVPPVPKEHSVAIYFAAQGQINIPLPLPLPPQPHPLATILPISSPRVGNKGITRFTLYVPLYQAAMKGDWEKAREFLSVHPDAINVRITKGHETILHIAAGAKHIGFVEEVVKLMSASDLALQNKDKNTALFFAATSGVTRIAEVMVNKNKALTGIRGNKEVTPLHIAALFGHRELVWYLYNVTTDEDLTQEDHIGLLIATITTNLFDVALQIIQSRPELAIVRDPNGETALHVLARKPSAFTSKSGLGIWQKVIYPWIYVKVPTASSCPSTISKNHGFKINQLLLFVVGKLWCAIEVLGIKVIHEQKLLHVQALELVKRLWEQILLLDHSKISDILRSPSRPLFVAAEFGIVEIIIELIRSYPDLIWKVDEQSRSIFHIAVMHRQEKIFNLINDIGAYKDMITPYKDENNHNMLHLAGKMAHPSQLNIVSGAALQMQRELLWFKEVEKNVQPLYKEMRDTNGREPGMLFTEEHRGLVKEGEKWMKNTASSCMLVATLITTIMFAAIFTVPGGNDNQKGTPIFLGSKSFITFAISDALALFSSVTSILMFLSILTSRYAEEDFLECLPRRLILGLATLFFSIASMLVAFVATFFIVLGHQLAWIVVPVALIACIPVTLFAFLQFPLLVDMFHSSYGSGIFARKSKDMLY